MAASITVAVDVSHKLLQTFLGVECLLPLLSVLIGPEVGQRDGDTGIEVCQFAHAACPDVPLKGGGGEDGGVGPELLTRATAVCLAYYLHGIEWLALLVFLLVYLAIAKHLGEHVRGEGVDATHTHTVKASAHLVRALVKLAAGM